MITLRIAGTLAAVLWLLVSICLLALAATVSKWLVIASALANTIGSGLFICALRCPTCYRPVHLRRIAKTAVPITEYYSGSDAWTLFMVDECQACGTDLRRVPLSRRTFGLSRRPPELSGQGAGRSLR